MSVEEHVEEGIFRFSKERGTAEESHLPCAVSFCGPCVGAFCFDRIGEGHAARNKKKENEPRYPMAWCAEAERHEGKKVFTVHDSAYS